MAQAPTRLKALFYGSPTVGGILRTLAKAGCLSDLAHRKRRDVAQLIRTTLAPRDDAGPAMPGPSPADDLVNALIANGYLNDRGLEWARTIVHPA
jgi:hypothetical protein